MPADVKKSAAEAIKEGYARAWDSIEGEIRGAGKVTYDIENDEVLSVLTNLVTQHVGAPLSPDDHEAALSEATRRCNARIPPGYLDYEKADGDGPDGAAGDYLVWLQSIKEAEHRSLPLIIVTGDEKDDWWWKHRGNFMGPRHELVEELRQRSQLELLMLRPVQLIDHASALNVAVPEDAAIDVARASTDDRSGSWTRNAVTELLRRLDQEGREQADVIRFAAAQGGVVDRNRIYEIADYEEDRMLRGFTRPTARITRALQVEGMLADGVEPMLTPIYDGGVTAVSFVIPIEVVSILTMADDHANQSG